MNAKLLKIYVDGYKNLIECSVDLHDFNVLVGPNNSGKSNFLEIFYFLGALIVGSDEDRKKIFMQGHVVRGDSCICHIENQICKPITVIITLEDTHNGEPRLIEYSVQIQCVDPTVRQEPGVAPNFGFISEKLTMKGKSKTGNPKILFSRTKSRLIIKASDGKTFKPNVNEMSSALQAIHISFLESNILGNEFLSALTSMLSILNNTKVLSASVNEIRNGIGSGVTEINSLRKATYFDILELISELHQNKIWYEEFSDCLCQILNIEKVRFRSIPIPKEFLKDSKDQKTEINLFQLKMHGQLFSNIRNFSDGTLMVIAILLFVFKAKDKNLLLCIEEPENCLHPQALKTLVAFLQQNSTESQIFLTTHSSYLLNLVSAYDVIIAHVCEDGSTKLEKIQNIKDLHKKLSKGFLKFGDMLEDEFKERKGVSF